MTSKEAGGWALSFVGRTLARRYRLVRVLGEGGVGAVFEAEHLAVGRRVAIKILLPEFQDKESVVERFHREARAAASCARSGVVEVTDLDHDPESGPFLVMEYLEGETLSDRLSKRGAMTVPQALAVALPMLETLAAVHARGIVHRDLKPGNVFLALDEHGREVVKILDFGMARSPVAQGASGPLTLPGHVLGTPRYMSPEQAIGDPRVDARSDLYAVGAILYTCLAGQPPYADVRGERALGAVLTGPPKPLVEQRQGLATGVVAAVERAMSRSPDDRYPDAVEMLRVLRTVGEPTPVAAAATLDMPIAPTLGGRAPSVIAPSRGVMDAMRAGDAARASLPSSPPTVGARPGAGRPVPQGAPYAGELPPTGAHATVPVDPHELARLAGSSPSNPVMPFAHPGTPAPGARPASSFAHPGTPPPAYASMPGAPPGPIAMAHPPALVARPATSRSPLVLGCFVGALGAGALALAVVLVLIARRDGRAAERATPIPVARSAEAPQPTPVTVAPVAPPVTSVAPETPASQDAAIPPPLRVALERGRAALQTGQLEVARSAYREVQRLTVGWTARAPESRALAYADMGLGDADLAEITDIPPLVSYATTSIMQRVDARNRALVHYTDAMRRSAPDINTCATTRLGRADERLGDVLTRLRAERPSVESMARAYRSSARAYLNSARGSYYAASRLAHHSQTCAEEGRLGTLRVDQRLLALPP